MTLITTGVSCPIGDLECQDFLRDCLVEEACDLAKRTTHDIGPEPVLKSNPQQRAQGRKPQQSGTACRLALSVSFSSLAQLMGNACRIRVAWNCLHQSPSRRAANAALQWWL